MPQRIGAGALRNRITVQEESSRTPDGRGGFAKTWGGAGHEWPVWAKRRFLSGGDQPEEEQTVSRRRLEYTVRRRSDVTFTSAMRVLDESMVLDVKTVVADDEDISAQKLLCEEVPGAIASSGGGSQSATFGGAVFG